jgi:hypothetical protein
MTVLNLQSNNEMEHLNTTRENIKQLKAAPKTTYNSDSHMVNANITSPLNQTTAQAPSQVSGRVKVGNTIC